IRGLKYDLRRRSLMAVFETAFMPFANLSDGQQGTIVLIADIARRMCLLNPHLGQDVLTRTNGLVAIDELDVHLHPAWQREILHTLRRSFPMIQIIATSHSPQMVGGLQPFEICILKDGRFEHPQTSFGLDSSSVLEEVMGVFSRDA